MNPPAPKGHPAVEPFSSVLVSLFTVHCSLSTVHCSLFTVHCPRFTVTGLTVSCLQSPVSCLQSRVSCLLSSLFLMVLLKAISNPEGTKITVQNLVPLNYSDLDASARNH